MYWNLKKKRHGDKHLAWLYQCLEMSGVLQHLPQFLFSVIVLVLDSYSTRSQMIKLFSSWLKFREQFCINILNWCLKPVLQVFLYSELWSHIWHFNSFLFPRGQQKCMPAPWCLQSKQGFQLAKRKPAPWRLHSASLHWSWLWYCELALSFPPKIKKHSFYSYR